MLFEFSFTPLTPCCARRCLLLPAASTRASSYAGRPVIRAAIRAVLSLALLRDASRLHNPAGQCSRLLSRTRAGQEAVGGTRRALVRASPWHPDEGTSGAEPAKNWDAATGESTEAINRAAGERCATAVRPATWETRKQPQMFYALSKLGSCWMPRCQKRSPAARPARRRLEGRGGCSCTPSTGRSAARQKGRVGQKHAAQGALTL